MSNIFEMGDWWKRASCVAVGGSSSGKRSSVDIETSSLPESHGQLDCLWFLNRHHCLQRTFMFFSQTTFMCFILGSYPVWAGLVLADVCGPGIVSNGLFSVFLFAWQVAWCSECKTASVYEPGKAGSRSWWPHPPPLQSRDVVAPTSWYC